MRSYAEFQHYFHAIADMHTGIQSFTTGDVDRIMSLQRSLLKYPCLWLETPEIKIASGRLVFSGAWVVLKNVETDKWQAQDDARELTYHIAEEVLQRMRDDEEEGLFTLEQEPRLNEISTFTQDHDYGWRCDFVLSVDEHRCLAPEYTNQWGEYLLSAFSWKNDTKTGLNVEFENLSIPDEGLTYLWTYQYGATSDTSTDQILAPIVDAGATDILTVTLKITNIAGTFCVIATALLNPGQIAHGYSVPGPLISI